MDCRSPRPKPSPNLAATAAAFVALLVLASACSSGPSANQSPKPTRVLTPAALAAQTGILTVTLTWSEPKGGAAVTSYNVFRDDALLFTVSAPTTTYTDNAADPGKTYQYEVQASGTTGISGRASVTVNAPVPDVSLARLDGDFDVKVKVLSKHNLFNIPARFTLAGTSVPSAPPVPATWSGTTSTFDPFGGR